MEGTKKILVAFYSWGNNTKAVAEYISGRLGADLLELRTKEAYPADYSACVRKVGRDGAAFEPELDVEIPDLSGYDMVFVGSPCWWGTIAGPLRTFLHQNDFTGKTIFPFMTHGTSGLHVQEIAKLCPGADVRKGHGIFNAYQVSTRKNTPENMGDYRADIDRWLRKIGLCRQPERIKEEQK